MNKIKKIFFEQDLTWWKIIVLSIICGVITGIIPLIHILDKTSIHNIAECYEMWVLLAMFIILNSKKPLEAGLKTFVFFLISQPLCYLVQVPFYRDGFGIFSYYTFWAFLTILTFPGAILAWYTKKKNWFSVLILSVALFLLNSELVYHFVSLLKSFPYKLLAVIFIIFEIILFIKMLFDDKIKRIVLYIFSILAIIFTVFFIKNTNNAVYELDNLSLYILDNDGYVLVEYEDGVEVKLDGIRLMAKTDTDKKYTIKLKDKDENIVLFTFSSDEGIEKVEQSE